MTKAFWVGLFLVVGCDRAQVQARRDNVASSAESKAAPAPTRTPLQEVQSAVSLDAALFRSKPFMEDKPNEDGIGVLLLLAWADKSMKWSDVYVQNNETTFSLVLKDAEEERGKRMCATGSLIQIQVEKTELGKVYSGLLISDAWNIYRFLGVGSSGSLVEKSRATFCGVVGGRYDYSNSGGGTGHAVKLVGMFDLPANRARL